MKVAVCPIMKVTQNTVVASTRMAKWIANTLNGEILDDAKQLSMKSSQKYDLIVIVSGVPVWCAWRKELKAFLSAQNCPVIFACNDYLTPLPAFCAPATKNRFISLQVYAEKNPKYQAKVFDWNKLVFIKDQNTRPWSERMGGLVYYGAFRERRVELFKRYLNTSHYRVYVSASSASAQAKFAKLLPGANFIGFNGKPLHQALQSFKSSIYMADEVPERILFHTPANRFYECLGAGLTMVFDEPSAKELTAQGFNAMPWAVKNALEAAPLLNHPSVSASQRDAWMNRDYAEEMRVDFLNEVKALLGSNRPVNR